MPVIGPGQADWDTCHSWKSPAHSIQYGCELFYNGGIVLNSLSEVLHKDMTDDAFETVHG